MTPINNVSPNPQSHKEALEIEKLQAEIAKYKVEANEIKKSWIRKPTTWQSIATIFFGICSIGAAGISLRIGYKTGFFDTKREAAEIAIAKLNDTKSDINRQINNLKSEVKNLNFQVSDLTTERDQLKSANEEFKKEHIGAARLVAQYNHTLKENVSFKNDRESQKWHEGNLITVKILEAFTNDNVKDAQIFRNPTLKVLYNSSRVDPREAQKYEQPPPGWMSLFLTTMQGGNNFKLTDAEAQSSGITLFITAPKHGKAAVFVAPGTTLVTVLLDKVPS